MTLAEIMTRSLAEQGRKSDAQTMAEWRERFTLYANDGIRDIANYLQLRRQDVVFAEGGKINVKDLQRDCRKVLSIKQGGSEKSFTFSPVSGIINTNASDGPVEISYRYLPEELVNDTDEPDLPEGLQHLLPVYVCYRDHMTNDPSQQGRASAYLQFYEDGKRDARKNYAEQDTFNIYKYGW